MAFSPQFLDDLRARIGLADVISRRVKLTRKGREHSGLCPFHKEKTPSFTVNEEKGFYHCFGCQAHGGAIDFVMNMESLSFPEAVERLAAEAGMEVPVDSPEERERSRCQQTLFDVMEAACACFEKCLKMPDGRTAMNYLHGRGLDDATIKNFRLGFARDSWGALKGELAAEGISEELMITAGLLIKPDDQGRQPYDRFRGRVMFPIKDKRGRVIAFGGRILGDGEPKYLNSPETPLFHKGRVLYGLDQAQGYARKAGTVLVTEGYMDVIALFRAGYRNAVAPLGTALTEEQIAELWRLAPEPVLCFDGDNAGQRAATRAAERVLPLLKPGFSLRFAVLPVGEDPDSLIERDGAQVISSIVDNAVALSEVLWRMEAGGRAINTPEESAALQKRMQDHARKINDSLVRGHFLSAIKDRLWAARRHMGKKHHGITKAMAPPLDAASFCGVRINPQSDAQKTLVASIINHPDMFNSVEEQIGRIGFSDQSLDKLRQVLVSVLSGAPDTDIEGVKDELKRRGLSQTLHALYSDAMIKNHRFIRPEASNDDVREAWNQSFRLLHNTALADDIEKIEGADSADPTEDEWRRIRALKEASLREE